LRTLVTATGGWRIFWELHNMIETGTTCNQEGCTWTFLPGIAMPLT